MKRTFLLSVFLFLAFATVSCDNESSYEGHWHNFEEIGFPFIQQKLQGNWVDIQGNISEVTATTINIVNFIEFEITTNSKYRYPQSYLGAVYQIKDEDFFLEIEFETIEREVTEDGRTIIKREVNYDKMKVKYNGEEVELTKQ